MKIILFLLVCVVLYFGLTQGTPLTAKTIPVNQGANATFLTSGINSSAISIKTPLIAKNALRLRIIANSNSSADQTFKEQVRDAVIAKVGVALRGVTDRNHAKAILMQMVPQIASLVTSMERQAHITYGEKTAVTPTEFPAKLYGDQEYPAGTYEALKIVLGAGTGHNWWCVLFPPLCFIALSDGDAIPATGTFPDGPPLAKTSYIDPTTHQKVQVALRLYALDEGEQLIKTWGATLSPVWKAVLHAL